MAAAPRPNASGARLRARTPEDERTIIFEYILAHYSAIHDGVGPGVLDTIRKQDDAASGAFSGAGLALCDNDRFTARQPAPGAHAQQVTRPSGATCRFSVVALLHDRTAVAAHAPADLFRRRTAPAAQYDASETEHHETSFATADADKAEREIHDSPANWRRQRR